MPQKRLVAYLDTYLPPFPLAIVTHEANECSRLYGNSPICSPVVITSHGRLRRAPAVLLYVANVLLDMTASSHDKERRTPAVSSMLRHISYKSEVYRYSYQLVSVVGTSIPWMSHRAGSVAMLFRCYPTTNEDLCNRGCNDWLAFGFNTYTSISTYSTT